MQRLHIITPVKDSWDTTRLAIDAILTSKTNFKLVYTVFNDFSNEINTHRLASYSNQYRFDLINLSEITTRPSPNYFLTLQIAKTRALLDDAHLLIIESDVIVKENTVQQLYDYANSLEHAGMVSAVTTDKNGEINFPYLYAKKYKKGVVSTRKRLSFCCTLLTSHLVECLETGTLNPRKKWFDIQVSRMSLQEKFNNYLITSCPVVHLPHSSRPWKNLKYSSPLKYYWLKFTGQLGAPKKDI